jgi:NTE family protein
VLDRILEDGRLQIAGVSGTSAGAMNAVALAEGFNRDGPEGGRAALDRFWRAMSDGAKNSPLKRTFYDKLTGNWGLENNPVYHVMDALSRIASPYQLNPMNSNPLRDLVEDSIDFDRVRRCTAFKLYISATNVESGKVKVFPREDLTVDMVMASACLPNMYQAACPTGTAVIWATRRCFRFMARPAPMMSWSSRSTRSSARARRRRRWISRTG